MDNSCLICNQAVPIPNSKQDLKKFLHKIEDLKKVEECFAINFSLSPEQKVLASFWNKPNIYPFCSACTTIAQNLVKLQTTLTEIENKLANKRKEIATQIINNFNDPLTNFALIPMRTFIYEKWFYQIQSEEYSQDHNDLDMSTTVKDETSVASEKTQNPEISREVAILKTFTGKGDKMPISIDEEEVEEVTCAVCNKIFRSKVYLCLHMKSHTGGARPFMCVYCGKSFFGSSTLKKHLSSRHPEQETKLKAIPAPTETELAIVTMEDGQEAHLIIGKSIKMNDTNNSILPDSDNETTQCSQLSEELMENSATEFGTDDSVLTCEYCGKPFASKVTLTKHIRTVHLKTIKVQCPICKMTTRDHYNLAKHVLNHNSKLTKLIYNCSLCGDGYRIRKDLQHHYKTDHKLDNYGRDFTPIIRALEEHEDANIFSREYDSSGIELNENTLSSLPLSSCSVEQVPSELDVMFPVTTIDTTAKQIVALPPVEDLGLSPGHESIIVQPELESIIPAGTENISIPTLEVNAELNGVKQRKKRRRRAIITYMPRTKILKRRMRQEAFASTLDIPLIESTIKIESNESLNFYPEKNDEVLLEEAQNREPTLKNLNFNFHLRLEKLQTVMLSPERETEEFSSQTIVNGMLQNFPSTVAYERTDGRVSIMANLSTPRMKIYGPKSKLDEIRARKLKLMPLNRNLCAENEQSSLATGSGVFSVQSTDNSEKEPSDWRKIHLRLSTASPCPDGKRREVWINASNSNIEKPLEKRPVSKVTGFRAQNGKKLKPRKNLSSSIQSRKRQRPIPTGNVRAESNLSQFSSTTPHNFGVAPNNAPTGLATSFIGSRKPVQLPPATYPLPNEHLDQISMSFRKRQRRSNMSPDVFTPRITDTGFRPMFTPMFRSTRTFPVPLPPNTVSNFNNLLGHRSSASRNPEVSGFANNIEIKSRLAHKFGPFQTDSPIQALLRNSNIDVSFLGAKNVQTVVERPPIITSPLSRPLSASSTEFRSASVTSPVRPLKRTSPSGIHFVQVQDILKGTSNSGSRTTLSPAPKRRFLQSKVLHKGTRNQYHRTGTSTKTPTIESIWSARKVGKPDTSIPMTVSPTISGANEQRSDTGPIRIRSLSSLLDFDAEVEETELYQPDVVDDPKNITAPTAFLYPGTVTASPYRPHPPPIPKMASYRPFPKNESTPIMTYSEHMRMLQQQSTISVQQIQPIVAPKGANNYKITQSSSQTYNPLPSSDLSRFC